MKFMFVLVFMLLAAVGCQTSKSSVGSSSAETGKVTSQSKRVLPKDDSIIPRGFDFGNAPEIVAFGSCANQDLPQPLWDVIYKNNPELFIFSGDNVYASQPQTKPIAEQYRKLNLIPEFRHFRENVPMMATWDDHDYGVKDSGVDNPEKEDAKREFLNQWTYVKDSRRLDQKGIYHAKILGGVKKNSPSLQVILLDTRWFRSPLKMADDTTNPNVKFLPTDDKKTTVLGEEQWAWLERQLRKPANVRIIVSSIQLIANDHSFEKWGNFPHERERFFNLLRKTQARNLFVVSGDRHRGAIAKQEIKGWGTLFDITASGINKTTTIDEVDKTYVGAQVMNENFGVILLNWSQRKVELQLRDISNKVVNQVEMKIR